MVATGSRAVNILLALLFASAVALAILVAARPAYGTTTQLDLAFDANESLFQGGGPGREWSGNFGSTAGVRYEISAELGVVQSAVNGLLTIEHPEVVHFGIAPTIEVQFLGEPGVSRLASNWDMGVDVDAFLPCVAPTPFGCLHPRTIPLLSEGFELEPIVDFTAVMGSGADASDVDNAAGVGPNIDIPGVGELGAEVSLDIAQSIELTGLELKGLLEFRNRSTGVSGDVSFLLDSPAARVLDLGPLGPGQWDFSLFFRLSNDFHHHAEFQLRPNINYIVGEWPPPGTPVFTVDLADNRYSLDFSNPSFQNAFTVEIVPEPTAMVLVIAIAGAVRLRRPRA